MRMRSWVVNGGWLVSQWRLEEEALPLRRQGLSRATWEAIFGDWKWIEQVEHCHYLRVNIRTVLDHYQNIICHHLPMTYFLDPVERLVEAAHGRIGRFPLYTGHRQYSGYSCSPCWIDYWSSPRVRLCTLSPSSLPSWDTGALGRFHSKWGEPWDYLQWI